jgi:hypothetical protein
LFQASLMVHLKRQNQGIEAARLLMGTRPPLPLPGV